MLKANVKKYVTSSLEVPPFIEKDLKGLNDVVDRIDTDYDIEEVVKKFKTGEEIPEPFEYEQYQEVKSHLRLLLLLQWI
jgi:hypothetical protein